MATHLHLDCFNGISGDMMLGALVDLGVDIGELEGRLKGLPIGDFGLSAKKITRAGIVGTRVRVHLPEGEDDDAPVSGDDSGGTSGPPPVRPPHADPTGHTHTHEHKGGEQSGEHEHSHAHDHSHEHSHSHSHTHAHATADSSKESGEAGGGAFHDHALAAPHSHDHTHTHSHDHAHVRLGDVVKIVRAAGLGELATQRAIAAYQLIAEAEAHVHGSTPEEIHFHEVGANDAIIDIAGAMVGVEMLGAQTFSCSTITVGSGTVRCAHGVMPVPAPATAEILKGAPTAAGAIASEMTTPTGAAIARVLAGSAIGAAPTMRTACIGYGGGSREFDGHPNYLRLVLGEIQPEAGFTSGINAGGDGQSSATGLAESTLPVQRETILSLETEIDDMSPELAGYLMERLFEAGARDVHFAPVQMKKNRPGSSLRVLASPDRRDVLAEIILRETSTFGLRIASMDRLCLERRVERVQTPLGEVAVKIGLWGDDILKVSPEYEDCRRLARESGRPLREVFDLARRAIDAKYFGTE